MCVAHSAAVKAEPNPLTDTHCPCLLHSLPPASSPSSSSSLSSLMQHEMLHFLSILCAFPLNLCVVGVDAHRNCYSHVVLSWPCALQSCGGGRGRHRCQTRQHCYNAAGVRKQPVRCAHLNSTQRLFRLLCLTLTSCIIWHRRVVPCAHPSSEYEMGIGSGSGKSPQLSLRDKHMNSAIA